MKLKSKYGNLCLGIAAVVVGAVIFLLTRAQGLEFLKNGMPGAGMFPTLCAVAIMVCGVLLILEVLSAIKKAKQEEAENLELEKNLFNLHEIRNLLIFLILGIFILLLSDYIGLLTCLCLSIIVYIKIQGKDPIWKAIFIGVAATIFLYIVFVWFLHVPVPEGPLGF